jgi:hypothetical protein
MPKVSKSKKKLTAAKLPSTLDDFLGLSRILTGVQTLDAGIAGQYLDRLNSSPLQPALATVLRRFRDISPGPAAADQVKKKIVADDGLRPVVSQIILLWYTSAMRDGESGALSLRFGTQDGYFSGLVWTIIGAHPPGLSGGYFGHWRYAPENEPK